MNTLITIVLVGAIGVIGFLVYKGKINLRELLSRIRPVDNQKDILKYQEQTRKELDLKEELQEVLQAKRELSTVKRENDRIRSEIATAGVSVEDNANAITSSPRRSKK